MNATLRHKIIGVAAVAVVSGMLGVASSAAAATPNRSAHPPTGYDGPVLSLSSQRLATLEEAVAAGRLDRELVARLRSHGSVAGLVTFEQETLLERATRTAPFGKLRAAAVLSRVVPALRAKKQRALRQIDGEFRVLHQFRNLALTYVRFESESALLDAVNAPGVSGVRVNGPARAELSSSLRLVKGPQVSASGATGAGTYVAVLDSGVDYTHPAFGCTAPGVPAECRVAAVHEIAPDDGTLDSKSRHGTNVAGIVAGVAPGAKLIVDDVFDADGFTSHVVVSKAIDGLVAMKQQGINIRAVNLSLGNGQYSKKSCSQNPYRQSFDLLRSLGILPVVSAGNDAYDARHRFHVGISSPACVPGAISVGAVYNKSWGKMDWGECKDRRSRADGIVCFSQTGRPLTMLAPGAVITAAGVEMSGTSQAAPHVAGAVAVLAAVNPAASIDQIKIALATTGKPIRDKRSKLTRRRLDLAAAVAAIGVPPAPPPPADRTAPTLSGPNQSIPLGWSLGSGGATPLEVTWQGADPSGIAQYRLYARVNGGAQSEVTLPSPTATSVTFTNLQPGASYQFTVTAQDGAGNVGTATGPSFEVGLWQEQSQHITYSTGWQLISWAQSLGGYHAGTTNTGSWARFTFTGRAIAWVAPSSSINGEAYVWLDNQYLGIVNGYSAATTPRKVIFSRNVPYGTHTLAVQPVGTAGHAQIDIDAFEVLH